jgi:hypothetical protein
VFATLVVHFGSYEVDIYVMGLEGQAAYRPQSKTSDTRHPHEKAGVPYCNFRRNLKRKVGESDVKQSYCVVGELYISR